MYNVIFSLQFLDEHECEYNPETLDESQNLREGFMARKATDEKVMKDYAKTALYEEYRVDSAGSYHVCLFTYCDSCALRRRTREG